MCTYHPVSLGNLYAVCEYGSIGQNVMFGVSRPKDGNPFDQCLVNDNNRACVPDNPVFVDLVNSLVGQSGYVNATFDTNDLFLEGSGSSCLDDHSQVFLQYSCVMSD